MSRHPRMIGDPEAPRATAADPPGSAAVSRLVALVFFIQLLDSTIIGTSLPQMAADFGATPVAMSVGVTANLLAMAVVLPAAGWIGERFGARRVLILSVSGFTLASLARGLAARLTSSSCPGSFGAARRR